MSAALAGLLNGYADQKKSQKAAKEREADRALRREAIEASDRASERSVQAARAGRSLPADLGGGAADAGAVGFDGTSAGLIAGFEGFRENPYWDVNAHRVGFGSDTVTLADGSVVAVTPETLVSREDAMRDLDRRISTEFRPSVIRAVGQERYDALNPSQQAVLDSLAYNYGAGAWDKGLAPVARAIRAGGDVAGAINSLGSHNEGVNAKRRAREASLWGGVQAAPAPVAAVQARTLPAPATQASSGPGLAATPRSFSITPGGARPWQTFGQGIA